MHSNVDEIQFSPVKLVEVRTRGRGEVRAGNPPATMGQWPCRRSHPVCPFCPLCGVAHRAVSVWSKGVRESCSCGLCPPAWKLERYIRA